MPVQTKIEVALAAMIVVLLLVFTLALGIYRRTQIADYDVKFAHTEMSQVWNYCPYCGEKLDKGESK